MLEKPAHTAWKKGPAATQTANVLSESVTDTGEIMCLVEVPAKYKTITKRILKTPETTCFDIFRDILREWRQFDVEQLLVLASQEVVDRLLDEESQNLAELEQFIGHFGIGPVAEAANCRLTDIRIGVRQCRLDQFQ